MFCNKCGAKLEEGTKFCAACGAKIADAVDEVAKDAAAKAEGAAKDVAAKAEDAAKKADDTAKDAAEKAKETAEKAEGAVKDAAKKVDEKAATAVDAAKDAVKNTEGKISPKVDAAKDAANGAINGAANGAINGAANGAINGAANGTANKNGIPAGSVIPNAAGNAGGGAAKQAIPMKIIGIIAAVLAVVVLIIVLVLTHKATVKPDKFINLSYNGYDSLGTATIDFDTAAFVKEYDGKVKVDVDKISMSELTSSGLYDTLFSMALGGELDLDNATSDKNMKKLKKAIKENGAEILAEKLADIYEVDPRKELTNGTKVTVSCSLSDEKIKDLEKTYGVKLKIKSKEFTVEGLKEIKKFDAFDGIEIEYSGYAPNATARIKKKGNDSATDYIDYKISPDSGLSDGDTITVTITDYSGHTDFVSMAESYGKVPSSTEKKITVEGVPQVVEFDPFEGVTLEYSGYAPDGNARLSSRGDDDACDYLEYKLSKTEGLSNGDVVTVTVEDYYGDSNFETVIDRTGKKPSVTTKDFVVEGLTSYVASLDQISQEGFDMMKSQAEDVFNAYVANDWNENVSLVSFDNIGSYLLTSKSNSWTKNQLYLVYKYKAKIDLKAEVDGKTEKYKRSPVLYWAIKYNNLMLDSDGKLAVDVTSYDVIADRFEVDSKISSGWFSTYSWTFRGYEKLDLLYQKNIMAQIADYNHEDAVEDAAKSTQKEENPDDANKEDAEDKSDDSAEDKADDSAEDKSDDGAEDKSDTEEKSDDADKE